jgi:D-alanine-D-alanine ligase
MDGYSSILGRRVALLMGGDSAEREISLASGRQAAAALSHSGYEPSLIDPRKCDLSTVDWTTFDVCYIALHGGSGEDGRIQQKLEHWGVPYTGSGPEASRLAMNKSAAKRQFKKCGVPSLPWVVFSSNEMDFGATNFSEFSIKKLQQKLAPLGFPVVIKPESQGSSLGVCVAREQGDLAGCLAIAAKFDECVLAEPFAVGREFTISLLGRDPLPMIEIVAQQRLFTYEAKYCDPATDYRLSSNLPTEIELQLYQTAIAAADALGTAGLVRVDLMLDQYNRSWVLEINTIPGMTERSLSPRAARAAGMEMPALVDWMVRDAVSRSAKCAISEHKALLSLEPR